MFKFLSIIFACSSIGLLAICITLGFTNHLFNIALFFSFFMLLAWIKIDDLQSSMNAYEDFMSDLENQLIELKQNYSTDNTTNDDSKKDE